jgi:integrase
VAGNHLARDIINIPAERVKNKRPHIVPLTPTTRAILEGLPRSGATTSVFEFTAWAYNKDILDKRSGVSGWVIHDIRRTVATGMADIGLPPHVIEAVLNHISGHKGGVAGIYNRASYAKEKVEALARWNAHLTSVVGGPR